MLLRNGKMRISRVELVLACWIVVSFISSLLSANPVSAIMHSVDLSLAVAVFFLFAFWRGERLLYISQVPFIAVGVLLGCCSLVVAIALLSGTLHLFPFMAEFIMSENDLIRIRMTMWEANLFGALMMIFSLLSIAEFRKNRYWSWFCVFVCHAGMLLAYSRGPFIGYFLGLLLYCHLLGYRRIRRLFLVLLTIIILMSGMQLIRTFTGAVDESKIMRSSTLIPRLLTMQRALEDVAIAPFIGNGTYSFEFLHAGEAITVGSELGDAKGWISILPIAVLHDTGLIGFILFSSFFLLIFQNGIRGVRQRLRQIGTNSVVPRRMAAWLGAALGMLVLSISTSAYSLAVFWFVMAVVASIPWVWCRRPAG